MRTTSQNTQTTKTVNQGESRYGTAEPQIELRLPKRTSHRLVNAAVHKLAVHDDQVGAHERQHQRQADRVDRPQPGQGPELAVERRVVVPGRP